MPKKSKDNFQKKAEGVALEEINSNIKLVLEHVVGLTKKSEKDDLRFDAIDEKLESIEVKLVGKADNSRVDKLERRVSTLEH